MAAPSKVCMSDGCIAGFGVCIIALKSSCEMYCGGEANCPQQLELVSVWEAVWEAVGEWGGFWKGGGRGEVSGWVDAMPGGSSEFDWRARLA